MSPGRIAIALVAGFLAGGAAMLVLHLGVGTTLHVVVETDGPEEVQIFWSAGRNFRERSSCRVPVEEAGEKELSVALPRNVQRVRLDPISGPGSVRIRELRVSRLSTVFRWSSANRYAGWRLGREVEALAVEGDHLLLESKESDPRLVNDILAHQMAGPLRNQTILAGLVVGLIVAVLTAIVLRVMPGRIPETSAERPSRRPRPEPDEVASRQKRRWAPKLALALGTFLVFGALAWTLLRSFSSEVVAGYRDPTDAYGMSFLNDRGERISDQEGPLGFLLDPFTFYRYYPNHESDHFVIDEHGFRGGVRDESLPKVVVMGGSAAFGWGLDSDEETVSAQLDLRLEDSCCVNAAAIGYLSGQELSSMVHYADDLRPEVYVAIDGWNDYIQHKDGDRALGVNGTFHLYSARLHRYNQMESGLGLSPWPFPAPAVPSADDERIRRCLDVYVKNLDKMSAWARGRGARFLVVFQPIVACKRTRTAEEQTYHLSKTDADLYRGFVQVARRRCSMLGIDCLDLNEEAEFCNTPETLFFDPVHPNAAGHALIAEILAERLRAGER